MIGSIRFPNLGITLPHVIKSISVGNFQIAVYGIVLALAMVSGVFIVVELAKAGGESGDEYFNLALIAIIAAVIGARIYYVLFSWEYYRSHPLEIFNLRGGGLAIYGGIIGGFLAVLIYCRIRKLNLFRALDVSVVGVVWGQMVGRWGNFFNREAFGDYTDNLLAMQLPLGDVNPSAVTEAMREHIQTVDGVAYIQVHPTFLYESLWNLGVFLILLILTFRWKKREQGMIFLGYLLLYGIGRFWIESLRTDQLILFGTGLPVSQLLSGILVIVSLILMIFLSLRKRKKDRDKA